MMLKTVRDARQMVRRQPLLLALLGIGLFYGLYSEGFDRLWTPHLLENFVLPSWLEGMDAVVWFGVVGGVAAVVSLVATEVVRRRVDTSRSALLGQALMWNAGGIVLALAGFGLTRSFWVAVVLYWAVGVMRSVRWPLASTGSISASTIPRCERRCSRCEGRSMLLGRSAVGQSWA
jgi:DHA3 family tetracycline resistance protein-like MFS transporter